MTDRTLRMNWRLLGGVFTVIAFSSAPFVQFAQRVFHSGLASDTAAFSLGVTLPCVVVSVMFGAEVQRASLDRRNLVGIAACAALAALLLASTFWSGVAAASSEEAVLVVSVMAGGLWFGAALDRNEQLQSIVIGTQMLVLLSMVSVQTSPWGKGVGGWVGVFASRNTLGGVAALAALAAGTWIYANRPSPPLLVGVVMLLLLDVVVLAGSGSRTPVAAACVAIAVAVPIAIVSSRSPDARTVRRLSTLVGYGVAVLLAVLPYALIQFDFSDRLTSDRSAVWRGAFDEVSFDHPFGRGYRAIWTDGAFVVPVHAESGLVFDNAHNTMIEVLLGTGLVGALLVVLVMGLALTRRIEAVLRGGARSALGGVVIVVFCMVENVTEAFIVYQSIFWMLLLAGLMERVTSLNPVHPGQNASRCE